MFLIRKTAILICLLVFFLAGNRCLASCNSSTMSGRKSTHHNIVQRYSPRRPYFNKRWAEFPHHQGLTWQATSIKRQALSADTTVVHIIKQGETLYSIANEYDVSVSELKRWNHLTSNTIQAGGKLRIYPQKGRLSATSLSTAGQRSGRGSYTVKDGDTLFRISQMFHTSVEKLKALNHLTTNTIRIGQKLKVPPASGSSSSTALAMRYGKFTRFTLKESQPLKAILAKFHMSKKEFRALNPGFSSSSLHKGDKVEVLIPSGTSRKNPYLIKKSFNSLRVITATRYKPNAFGPTTNGELYNPDALTAGSSSLKLGTVIFLKNKRNDRGVFVRINDRTTGSGLKLSKAAWDALGLDQSHNKVAVYRVHE